MTKSSFLEFLSKSRYYYKNALLGTCYCTKRYVQPTESYPVAPASPTKNRCAPREKMASNKRAIKANNSPFKTSIQRNYIRDEFEINKKIS